MTKPEESKSEVEEAPEEVSRNTRGINIGANTVTQATEHLSEEERLLIRWLHVYARDQDWEWEDVVKAVGYSSTTWYRIWTDKYRYPKWDTKVGKDGVKVRTPQARAGDRMPVSEHCAEIRRFKKLVEQREAVARAGFVETSVWKRVEWVCQRSFVRQRIGFVYGESQIGKTTCLEEYARRNNSGQTTYVELPPAAGVQLMTRAIARALHVSSNTCYEHLIQDVLDALDESKLLIVDEVHRVFTTYQKTSVMRCLDVLRYIHDKTKCGLVLCGTNVFRDQLKQGEFFQYLKQLRRRGLNEVQLPSSPPREDLDLMARKFGLDPDKHGTFDIEQREPGVKGKPEVRKVQYLSEDIMQHLAKTDGFGKFVIRLQDAVELARKRDEKPSWFHFVRAHDLIERMATEAAA